MTICMQIPVLLTLTGVWKQEGMEGNTGFNQVFLVPPQDMKSSPVRDLFPNAFQGCGQGRQRKVLLGDILFT